VGEPFEASNTMSSTTKEVAKDRRRSPRRRTPDVDAVLLRCATIERRLEGIDAMLNIQGQRLSALQEQIDHLASKRRR
jgi:hypothetical protein